MLFNLVPLTPGILFALHLLAGLAMLAALGLVATAYGLRLAALVGIVAFAELSTSPIAGGVTPSGSLIAAAAVAGLAATELERWALAGALLGFVCVELVWPAWILVGLIAKLGVDWLGGRERKRELVRLAIGAGASVALCVLVSATLPGGLGNWAVWTDQVGLVRYLDGGRQIGLRWLFAPEGNLHGDPRWVPYPIKAQHLVDRSNWILVSALLLMTPSLLAVRRLPPVAFAAIAGVTATFALTSIEGRGWAVALPVLALAAGAIAKQHPPSQPLVGRPTTILIAGCLALIVGMHGLIRLHQSAFFVFNVVYSHLLTTLLLGLAVALIVLPDLREHGDPPGGPPAVPVLNPETAAAPSFPLLAWLRGRKPAAASQAAEPEQGPEQGPEPEHERGER
jgi:hypothetical protein